MAYGRGLDHEARTTVPFPEVQGKGRGDLIVHIDVRIPTKLTRDQRRIFEELEDTLPVDNDPHEKGLLDKVKDYFM